MPGNVILFFLFRLSLDVDKAEKDNRDKETKILNLTRELDEMRDMYDKQKYSTTTLQRELDDLVSSKDDVGKNVNILYDFFITLCYCGTIF
jgi:myosin protein heavy chain